MPSVVAAAASQEQEQQPAGGLLLEAASGVRYAPLTLLLHAPSRPEAEETTMQPNAEGAAERSRMLSISMYLHLSQLFYLTHFVQSMPLVGVCAQLCWKRCLQQPVMCYSILSCQHAAVQTHHAASEHHSTSWQSRSCLCGITAFIVAQDEKQGEQQAAGGDAMDMQDDSDNQEEMPTPGQLSFDPLHDHRELQQRQPLKPACTATCLQVCICHTCLPINIQQPCIYRCLFAMSLWFNTPEAFLLGSVLTSNLFRNPESERAS